MRKPIVKVDKNNFSLLWDAGAKGYRLHARLESAHPKLPGPKNVVTSLVVQVITKNTIYKLV